MDNMMMFNIGDIIATFFLLGFFILAIVLVVAAVKSAANKNKKLQSDETDLQKRIKALELRVKKLENEQ
ncbi:MULTISPECIES: hypothetical protein [unclassified Planococcus (in: firmicutes)]|uniref:hypothetical protein n=1 Tax=Planococcus TaxID=1372 RepID=UPI000C346DFF|nr:MULTISPECIES: hypothetical protein [unclassified Planococcus (in: firmicutes)]AUD15175.1 hypothetical protein CW734_17665 [Planococcus sp. MB-3u-03]PKG46308.1 hypothetical protein CXF66_07965 [Planococcus sp. Urea-trap-24]PKG90094.1 hypothetical protein CXF91_04310 [Planococcus sp. Urea-3u-39]PKH35806.1 hypothetical protein CXF77_16740 [Planococcus sp. MB-3u-09]